MPPSTVQYRKNVDVQLLNDNGEEQDKEEIDLQGKGG